MTRRFGRLTIDDRGIRQGRRLLLFGTPFDLTWDQITSWDSVEAILASPHGERVVSRILEVLTASTVHHIRWSGSATDYGALVEEIRRRAPDKQKPGLLRQIGTLRQMS